MSVRSIERSILIAQDTDLRQVEDGITELHRMAPFGYSWADSTDKIDTDFAGIVADLTPTLRKWYTHIQNKDTLLNLVTYAQVAYPDIPISEWFYKGIEQTVMQQVVQGNSAHTNFISSLIRYSEVDLEVILKEYSHAFREVPRHNHEFRPRHLLSHIPEDMQYYVIWNFGQAIFSCTKQPIGLFNSWLSLPREEAKTDLIAYNLEQFVKLWSYDPALLRSVQKTLHITQFGKFNFETILAAYQEAVSREKHDIMFAYIHPEKDKDQSLVDADSLQRDIVDFRRDSIDCGFVAFEFRTLDELKQEIKFTLSKTNKQAIIILHGHSNKYEYSQFDISELTDLLQSVIPQDDRNMSIIFVACSTGKRQGVAYEVSKLGIHTIAPNKDTWLYDLSHRPVNNNLIPHVVYKHGQTVEYRDGKEIARYEH